MRVLQGTRTLDTDSDHTFLAQYRPQCNTEAAGISDPVCCLRSRDKGLEDRAMCHVLGSRVQNQSELERQVWVLR